MRAVEKAEVLAKVASSSIPKRTVLGELGVPRSTYYRWLRRTDQEEEGLHGTDSLPRKSTAFSGQPGRCRS